MPKRGPSGEAPPPRVRKNMDMDPHKLLAAQRVLGARTETETVDIALDHVLLQGEVFDALDKLAVLGGLEDVYARASARSPRGRRVAER